MSLLPFHLQNTMLPESYTVGPNDVIIGRGKKCSLNPGNQRFREIVRTTLESYSNAATKARKSEIIMQVMAKVRVGNSVGFVKQHSGTGRYLLVEEASCRIAIAQAFRDALSHTYKSSKKSKQIRRLERMRASASEESLAGAAMHVQRLFADPSVNQNAPNASWPTMQMRGPTQEPVIEPQPFTLSNSGFGSFMAPPTSNMTDSSTEPLPWCNRSVRAATNSELIATLIATLGANSGGAVCHTNDAFEPTPLRPQSDPTSFCHRGAPSAA